MLSLDLGAVTFMDSSGIQALLLAREGGEACGVKLVICSVSPFVRRLLDQVGLPPEVLALGREVPALEA